MHARFATASCRACVDACPRAARHLDDERLALDLDACDGCGLCVPACPEDAIELERTPHLAYRDGRLVARIACEPSGARASEGVLPCVHALGLRDLLALHRRGVAELRVTRGDCASCPRGVARRLDHELAELERALAERGERGPCLEDLPLERWQSEAGAAAADEAQSPDLSRRGLLRRGLASAIGLALEAAAPRAVQADEPEPTPLGDLIPRRHEGDRMPFVPMLDAERCTGCDACVRMCPHGALARIEHGEEVAYAVEPARCTGCGLCRDVCDAAAVSLARWARGSATELRLRVLRCRRCGVSHHWPLARPSTNGRCPICQRVDHAGRLFQVLD